MYMQGAPESTRLLNVYKPRDGFILYYLFFPEIETTNHVALKSLPA